MTAKLVTIGDSLTQGFQHGAIRRTEWSYPAMIAAALNVGLKQADFSGDGLGGPLLDLELLSRKLERYGAKLNWWEVPGTLRTILAFMDGVEDYWERELGTRPSNTGPLHHNLAVWGFEVLDALTLSDGVCARNTHTPKDNFISQIPEFGMYRTARRVLNPRHRADLEELTALGMAAKIADDEGGIENLLIALGANNALASCLSLELRWSQSADFRKLAHQRSCTLWEPEHFAKIYAQLAARVKEINPARVFVATVPHVTAIPVTRGVSPRHPENPLINGYYEYYTHFWIWDQSFDPDLHPRITREDAQTIDLVIDEYNAQLKKTAQENGWWIIDFCGTLDALAFRRQKGKPTYRFPARLLDALKKDARTSFRVRPDGTVLLDTRYFQTPVTAPSEAATSKEWQMAYKGGLVGLDGVHPTTIGYGLMAHEALKVMKRAGVPNADPDSLDWSGIVKADTLVNDPPTLFSALKDSLGFLFSRAGLSRLIKKLSGYGSQADE